MSGLSIFGSARGIVRQPAPTRAPIRPPAMVHAPKAAPLPHGSSQGTGAPQWWNQSPSQQGAGASQQAAALTKQVAAAKAKAVAAKNQAVAAAQGALHAAQLATLKAIQARGTAKRPAAKARVNQVLSSLRAAQARAQGALSKAQSTAIRGMAILGAPFYTSIDSGTSGLDAELQDAISTSNQLDSIAEQMQALQDQIAALEAQLSGGGTGGGAINPPSVQLSLGQGSQSLQFLIDGQPASPDNGAVQWSSSDPSIVNVDQNGNVAGYAAGSASVTATQGAASATAQVTVADPNAQYQGPNAPYQDPYQDPNAPQYQDPYGQQYQDPNAQYQDPNAPQYPDPTDQGSYGLDYGSDPTQGADPYAPTPADIAAAEAEYAAMMQMPPQGYGQPSDYGTPSDGGGDPTAPDYPGADGTSDPSAQLDGSTYGADQGLNGYDPSQTMLGIDWLDFASKAAGALAQGGVSSATKPDASANATANPAAAQAAVPKAQADAAAANTKWYVIGGVAALGLVGLIVAKAASK